MVGWTVLLGLIGIMILFALSIVVTSRKLRTIEDRDEVE